VIPFAHRVLQLDPNRVLDLMLDGLEQHPSASLLHVIQQYTAGPSALSGMLGFKFESYAVSAVSYPLAYDTSATGTCL
jgi:hypothetical protein